MSNEESQQSEESRRVLPRILKVLTNNPGMVIYRDQIMEETGLSLTQVTSALHRIKNVKNSTVSTDVEVVIAAQAWRYVPSKTVQRAQKTRAVTESSSSTRQPLTTKIREYFIANPHKVVYLEQLREVISSERDEPIETRKVYQAINNAKITTPAFKAQLQTIVSGQAWQFIPEGTSIDPIGLTNPDSSAPEPTPTVVPAPAASVPVASTPTSERSAPVDTDVVLFERVGQLGNGDLLLRDEQQKLYRLTPMK